MPTQLDIFAPPPMATAHNRFKVDQTLGTLADGALIEEIRWGTFKGKGWSCPVIAIQLAQHTDNSWMWAHTIYSASVGSSYRIGPKWGKFAPTREQALCAAIEEIRHRIGTRHQLSSDLSGHRTWLAEQEEIAKSEWLNSLRGSTSIDTQPMEGEGTC